LLDNEMSPHSEIGLSLECIHIESVRGPWKGQRGRPLWHVGIDKPRPAEIRRRPEGYGEASAGPPLNKEELRD